MATYTMHSKNKSIHRELYCQVFDTKEFFVEAYPIQKKSYFHEALDLLIKNYWVPVTLIYYGSKEQVGLQYTRYPSTARCSSLAVNDRTLDVRVTSDRPSTP